MRSHHRILLAAALPLAIVALCTAPAAAKKSTLRKIAEHYKLPDTAAKCAICHEGKEDDAGEENLSVFGKQFRKALKAARPGADRAVQAMEAVADQDADGDGATNMEEIMLGTNPGDAKSKPDAAKLEEYRRANKKQ